jgi:hypothetical protein
MVLPKKRHGATEENSPRSKDGTTIMAQREFEFFVTTDQPHQPEGAQRGLIRRLVMRNFFDTKWSGTEKEGERSELSSEATLKAKGKLKTRFRLGQVPEEGKKRGNRTVKRHQVETRDRTARKSGTSSTRSDVPGRTQQSEKSTKRSPAIPVAESDGKKANESIQHLSIPVNISPSAHRLDPFDVLPVPGTQQLDLLFKLRKFPVFYCTIEADSERHDRLPY